MNPIFRSAALIVLLSVLVSPAFAASGGDKAKAPGAATANPEAGPINQRNPQVIHAGPGKPTVGHVHAPAGDGKDKKSGGH